jgi:RNA polymerase sigma-54 factor
MASKQGLTQTQKQVMRLSQAQVRFVRSLEMSAQEFDEAVKREVEENPALEANYDTDNTNDSYDGNTANTDNGGDSQEQTNKENDDSLPLAIPHRGKSYEFYASADNSESLYNFLEHQINETMQLSPDVEQAAKYIIGNLDSNGYLTRDTTALSNDLLFSEGIEISDSDMKEGLRVVQSLDPAGVGARSLQECLTLQIESLLKAAEGSPNAKIIGYARDIIVNHFDLLGLRHTHRIQSLLRISEEEMKLAMEIILRLNPKPGAPYGGSPSQFNYVVPDFIVHIEDDEITINLNNSLPELNIGMSFTKAMEDMARHRKQRKGSEFTINRYNDAREFIKIIERRQETLTRVMTAIIAIQKEYFLTEDESKLRPMGLKDIGEMTGYDLSVVSRSTRNKYVALPWGVLPLRFFFSESFGNEGEDAASGRKIENAIRKLIDNEDKRHPLSDDAICKALRAEGYDVSRRTINKYRDRLEIPVSRLRKQH